MNQIKSMLKPGMTSKEMHEIAATVGCSLGLIWMVRKELKMPPLPIGGARRWTDPKRIEEARRLKVAGWTYKEIGKHFGVGAGAVGWYLRIPGSREGSCENCGVSGKTLHCHHVSYEDNTNFKLLCPSCHSKEHPEVIEKAREILFGL